MAAASGLSLPDLEGFTDIRRLEITLQWLKQLPGSINKTNKTDFKSNQKALLADLLKQLQSSLPPALRLPLAECFIALFSAGDYGNILNVVNKCSDIIKNKDESMANRMTALQCIDLIFRHHGRMAGSCFMDVVQVLLKTWKSTEYRCGILGCLGSIVYGLENSSSAVHKDMYKAIRQGLSDKHSAVRVAAAKCAMELTDHSTMLYTNELDSIAQCCLKTFEMSSYDVRCSVSSLLGRLLAKSQQPLEPYLRGKVKVPSLEDCLSILSNGYTKGFLKVGGPELLKGGGGASREVRIGVAQAYVFFLTEMGGVWLERHLPLVLSHLLQLLCNPRCVSTHVEAVYSRKCVGFVIQRASSQLLGESSQLLVAEHLCRLIQSLNSTESAGKGEGPKSGSGTQHAIVCALGQIGRLMLQLITAAQPLLVSGEGVAVGGDNPAPLIKVLDQVLIHPSLAVRLSAAGTLYSTGTALPSLIAPLVGHLMKGLQLHRGSPEGVVGYSNGLSALLSSSQYTEVGIPSTKAMEIFTYGKDLVGTQFDGGKLSLANIQSGWALIGAYLSLGPSYVRVNLRNVVGLWHGAFPHSKEELAKEMTTGSLPSWKHTLESRIGALTSIVVFCGSCKSLLNEELCKRVMLPLESALLMIGGLLDMSKDHGIQLKASTAMLRLRIYQSFLHLLPQTYEGCMSSLLKEVVAEFTLTDNLASTTTSQLRSLCHEDDSILLGSWLEETDHKIVEEILQPNSAAGSGALEHDPASTYLYTNKGGVPAEPLPLGVAIIDTSILLFGRLFHQLSSKHQKQLLLHFKECIKQAKPANRQQAVQINIFTGFLAGLKGLVESKGSLSNDDDIIATAYSLIQEALSSGDPILRCAGSEALGRLTQVIGEAGFVGQVVQMAVTAITSNRGKTGHVLSLGCLHRYVGGMGSGQHLKLSVNTLQALATDTGNTIAQVWGIHALTLIADSGGPLFRNHVDSTLNLLLTLLMDTPIINTQMYRCLGNCLSALLTTLGPELQMVSKVMNQWRSTCLLCVSMVQCHPDAVVKSSAISCLQQLQLFAPSLVSMATEVPLLIGHLNNPHLLLRRAAANSLRQFSQQDATLVWATQAVGVASDHVTTLDEIILSKLDIETDSKLRFDLKETLFSLLTALAPNDPMRWLLLFNGVLSAAGKGEGVANQGPAHNEDQGGDEDDEMSAKFTSGEEPRASTTIPPRWATKVIAVECTRKIYSVCKGDLAHFDLSLAQREQARKGGDYLVMHLSELVKTSFIAATANVDQLKLEGYRALQDVIRLFAATPDPEYTGHVLLEQYQAQIGAALRPAFSSDSAPHVSAIACQVCGEWLGSGVSRDITDLKRVQQLLVASLSKLRDPASSLYGDAIATLESLAVLKAWAELYIKLSREDTTQTHQLIAPHLPILDKYWRLALSDYAYLSLPSKFNSQLPSSGGTFYNSLILDFVRPYYESNWAALLHAAAISISRTSSQSDPSTPETMATPAFAGTVPINVGVASSPADERQGTFNMVMGVATRALCNSDMYDNVTNVHYCLNAINVLVNSHYAKEMLQTEEQLVIELLELLHRIVLTTSLPSTILLTLDVAKNIAAIGTVSERVAKALLVVGVYCLFACVPSLAPPTSGPAQPTISSLSPADKCKLLPPSLSLLPLVAQLHPQPDNVIPLLLYLTVTALPHVNNTDIPLLSQSFKSICSHIEERSCHVLHSLIATLLPLEQASVHNRLLLTSIVLTLKSCTLPDEQLLDEWCTFAIECINKKLDPKLQVTALQVCETLFMSQKRDLAVSFIHKLSPSIVEFIQDWKRGSQSSAQSEVVIKATGVLEVLLKHAADEKKSVMMQLLLPLFISLLVPSGAAQSSVHRHILNSLISIGPLYPTAFRSVLTANPQLKVQLESAIKGGSSNPKTTQQSYTGGVNKPLQQPSIKLKMDFSNFK